MALWCKKSVRVRATRADRHCPDWAHAKELTLQKHQQISECEAIIHIIKKMLLYVPRLLDAMIGVNCRCNSTYIFLLKGTTCAFTTGFFEHMQWPQNDPTTAASGEPDYPRTLDGSQDRSPGGQVKPLLKSAALGVTAMTAEEQGSNHPQCS